MKQPRIAVAGCGAIASHFHIPILAANPRCRLVALAEADTARHASLKLLAPNATIFESWQQLLEKTDLDALVICLPPALHALCGLAALERNLHLYIEKPLAATTADAEALAAASKPNLVNRIGFNFRFHPTIVALRDQLRAGRIGPPSILRTTFTTRGAHQANWKLAPNSGGGVLLDLATHHIDLFRFLFDEPITSISAIHQGNIPHTALLHCQNQSGILMEGTFSLNTTDTFRLEALGPQGSLSFERYLDAAPSFRPPHHHWSRAEKILRGVRALLPANLIHGPGYEPSFALSLSAFLASIESGRNTHPDFEDGLIAQQLLDRISH
ncbi:MAG: Gfo/Idh/MocA family oxidoreductase [Acidobacteria bacterium]|nr:Gfo/Idh/MocA family oxidoreductase [Acidobacteriota bacterium]